jgi:hypothetical protein
MLTTILLLIVHMPLVARNSYGEQVTMSSIKLVMALKPDDKHHNTSKNHYRFVVFLIQSCLSS